MTTLISFLIAILVMMVAVAVVCAYMPQAAKRWKLYISFLFIMFLWFDHLIGMTGAFTVVTIGLIPLLINIAIFRNPTK